MPGRNIRATPTSAVRSDPASHGGTAGPAVVWLLVRVRGSVRPGGRTLPGVGLAGVVMRLAMSACSGWGLRDGCAGDAGPVHWCLVQAEPVVQAAQGGWSPPVGLPEQRHGGWHEDAADEGGVDGDGDG